MANKYCNVLFETRPEDVVKIKVPTGLTFQQGNVIYCKTLDTSNSDNIEVYSATPISDYTAQIPVLVINQGFEELTDGRRPTGQADPTQFVYRAGQTITGIRLRKGQKFEISEDALDNTGVVALAAGVYLIPQNDDYDLATASSAGSSASALYVEKKTTKGIGGQFGGTFITTAICVVDVGL